MDYRQRIINAFKELAVMRGFSRVTVDELAAHTGISKRTIYRYFNSKEEIILSVVEDFMGILEKSIQHELASSDKPVEKIRNTLKAIPRNIKLLGPLAIYDLQKYYPHIWEKIEQFRAERIQKIFEGFLSGDEQGYFKKVNPKIFSTALLSSIRSVINPAFIMDNNLSPEETIQSLFTIFLYGIVAKE